MTIKSLSFTVLNLFKFEFFVPNCFNREI